MSLRDELRRVAAALDGLFRPDGFNFAFLMNADPQVHLHVVPRYASPRYWRDLDLTDDHWGGAFGDEQNLLAPDLLGALAAEIRRSLPNE